MLVTNHRQTHSFKLGVVLKGFMPVVMPDVVKVDYHLFKDMLYVKMEEKSQFLSFNIYISNFYIFFNKAFLLSMSVTPS